MTHKGVRLIFEREMDCEGGIAETLRFPEPLRVLFLEFLSTLREILASTANAPATSYVAHNIYVDVIDNPDVNAVAFEADGHEFIGVNAGSIFYVYDAFLSLFSHPEFMPDVGHANKEHTTAKDLRNWLQRKDLTHIHKLTPVDPGRARAAQFLTLNAWNFIFTHEVGHLTKAHIRYLENAYKIFKYRAYVDQSFTEFETPLRHVMEAGADENAAHATLNIFKPMSNGRVLPEAGGLRQDFRSWAISVGVLFALFDRRAELHNPESVSSHPTPDVRLLNVLWSAWEAIKERVPSEFEAGTSQTLGATVELNSFFEAINMRTRPFLIVQGKAVRQKLMKQVAALRDRLFEIESDEMEHLAVQRNDTLRGTFYP